MMSGNEHIHVGDRVFVLITFFTQSGFSPQVIVQDVEIDTRTARATCLSTRSGMKSFRISRARSHHITIVLLVDVVIANPTFLARVVVVACGFTWSFESTARTEGEA